MYYDIFKHYIANHNRNKELPRTIRLLLDQHKEDLKKKGLGWEYYFDHTIPEKMCKLISKFQIVNDRKQSLELQPFQVFIIFMLFGWRKVSDGSRRFSEILYSVARKNGKSELFAALVFGMTIIEPVENNAMYAIANSKDQIKESIYAALGEIIKNTFPEFVKKKQIIVNQNEIKIGTTASMIPLASNTDNLDGSKPNIAVIDEMHQSYDPNKLQVLRSGMAARNSPLLAITTTAGFDKKSDYYQYYLEATNSLFGKQRELEKLYIIYELDQTDDPYDQDKWIKANPGLYTIKKPKVMLGLSKRAPYVPTEKNELMVKHLNRFISSGAKKYLDVDILKSVMVPPIKDPQAKHGTMGLDLSINDDLTCYGITIDGPKPYVILRSFVAEKYLDEKIRENPTYGHWLDSGLMVRCGESIDEDILMSHIAQDIEKYNIKAIGYDRYKAGAIIARLEAEYPHIMLKGINQKSGMSDPLKSFGSAVGNKKVDIEENPILTWMADNAILFENSGIYRITKLSNNSHHKIDGIVATVMSYYMYQLMMLVPQKPKTTINYDVY